MLNGLYQCTKNWQGNNEYDIKVRVKETEKLYSMQLVENNSRYSPCHIDMLFSKKDKIMIKKEKSQHSMNVWSDNDFIIYPFRAGIPFYFEKIKTAEEKIALGKKGNRMDNNEHGTNLAEVGTDCISRQQAIEIVRNRCKRYTTACVLAVTEIKQLPPIQPKRGRWHYSDGKPARIGLSFGVICDQCGTESEYCTNFCGECGADMRQKGENSESN